MAFLFPGWKMKYLNRDNAQKIDKLAGTPSFVYSEKALKDNAKAVLAFPNAFGLTARYAMKANPNGNILRVFNNEGLHIDASSSYEVQRAMKAGIAPEKIQLTSQELPTNSFLDSVFRNHVNYTACSLEQLNIWGQTAAGSEVTVRINPGLGSGGNNRTNTGGPASSFGIWHEYISDIKDIARKYNLTIKKIHTHIGSGSDPEIWQNIAKMSLDIVKQFPHVTRLNLGGGYKVDRMHPENSTDLQKCGEPVKQAFIDFEKETGRKLHLEIEPGTYLVANAGAILSVVDSIKSTRLIETISNDIIRREGYRQIIANTGMTENARIALYGAHHPIELIPINDNPREKDMFIIAGHCCESGDILTPVEGDPEKLAPILLPEPQIGDFIATYDTGAYGASMAAKNYNSFPEAAEILIRENGDIEIIRERQTLEQITQNEVPVIKIQ